MDLIEISTEKLLEKHYDEIRTAMREAEIERDFYKILISKLSKSDMKAVKWMRDNTESILRNVDFKLGQRNFTALIETMVDKESVE